GSMIRTAFSGVPPPSAPAAQVKMVAAERAALRRRDGAPRLGLVGMDQVLLHEPGFARRLNASGLLGMANCPGLFRFDNRSAWNERNYTRFQGECRVQRPVIT